MVEVVVLAPIIVACAAAFACATDRLAATASAEAALSNAVAADAAGTSIRGSLHGRARLVAITPSAITISVPAPLGDIRRTGARVR